MQFLTEKSNQLFQTYDSSNFALICPIIFFKSLVIILKQQQLFISLIDSYEKDYFWLNLLWLHINCDRPCEVVLNIK